MKSRGVSCKTVGDGADVTFCVGRVLHSWYPGNKQRRMNGNRNARNSDLTWANWAAWLPGTKVGRAPAAPSFAADTGWDTD